MSYASVSSPRLRASRRSHPLARARHALSGEMPASSPAFLPANPFAVPLLAGTAQQRGASYASVPDCGPGLTREPILGMCLPSGSDPTKCPPGMRYRVGVGCEFIPQGTGCPPGTQSDPMGISCWPTGQTGVTPTPPTSGGGCPTGYTKDPVTGTLCLPTSWPVPGSVPGQGLPSAPGCFFGQVKDAAGNCVFPFCGPGYLFNVSTGACEPTDTSGSAGGYNIVTAACDLLPVGLRPPGCPAPTPGTSTPSTPAANLTMLCDLIPSGWPKPPGCGAPSVVLPDGREVPITPTGETVEETGSGTLLALLALGAIGIGAVVVIKRKKDKKAGRR